LADIPGVQAFVLIDDLLPKGGTTLALAGSHQLKGQPCINDNSGAGSTDSMMIMGNLELPVLE
jgi:hypothetical protein